MPVTQRISLKEVMPSIASRSPSCLKVLMPPRTAAAKMSSVDLRTKPRNASLHEHDLVESDAAAVACVCASPATLRPVGCRRGAVFEAQFLEVGRRHRALCDDDLP